MLHSKFQASEKVVLKKKILEYFSMYFCNWNLGPPSAEPSSDQRSLFEQTW